MRALLSAIGRGAFWKLGSDLLGRVLQYALLWVAARSLGRADFGDFTFALSIGFMLAQVADFGLQLFVQRELARQFQVPSSKFQVKSSRPNLELGTWNLELHSAARLVGGGLIIKIGLSVVALALMG